MRQKSVRFTLGIGIFFLGLLTGTYVEDRLSPAPVPIVHAQSIVNNIQQVEVFTATSRPVAGQSYLSYILGNQNKCNGQPIVIRNGIVQAPNIDYNYSPAAGSAHLGSIIWRIRTSGDDVGMVIYWTQG